MSDQRIISLLFIDIHPQLGPGPIGGENIAKLIKIFQYLISWGSYPVIMSERPLDELASAFDTLRQVAYIADNGTKLQFQHDVAETANRKAAVQYLVESFQETEGAPVSVNFTGPRHSNTDVLAYIDRLPHSVKEVIGEPNNENRSNSELLARKAQLDYYDKYYRAVKFIESGQRRGKGGW